MDEVGKARQCVLNNIQKVLLCNTFFLGYDAFEYFHCDNFTIIPRHCHSRFCTSCGVKTQKTLAAKAEVMCLDVKHRHIVFTIPEEYRLWFRMPGFLIGYRICFLPDALKFVIYEKAVSRFFIILCFISLRTAVSPG